MNSLNKLFSNVEDTKKINRFFRGLEYDGYFYSFTISDVCDRCEFIDFQLNFTIASKSPPHSHADDIKYKSSQHGVGVRMSISTDGGVELVMSDTHKPSDTVDNNSIHVTSKQSMFGASQHVFSIDKEQLLKVFDTRLQELVNNESLFNVDDELFIDKYLGNFSNVRIISDIRNALTSKVLNRDILPIKTGIGFYTNYNSSLVDVSDDFLVVRVYRDCRLGAQYQWQKTSYMDIAINRKGEYFNLFLTKRLDITKRNQVQAGYNITNPSDCTHGRVLFKSENNGVRFFAEHYFHEKGSHSTHEMYENISATQIKQLLNEVLVKTGITKVFECLP